jgi:rSAM/selenodomain-associated transferase 1
MKKVLTVFVKAPVSGKVKTRLQADLGPRNTLRTYKSFIKDIISSCSELRGMDKFMACAPSCDDRFLKGMAKTWKVETFSQHGRTLGDKIVNGFNECFARGYSKVVIIGSDSPTIPLEYIRKAFQQLRNKDFVVGPSCDGGMYLVGARKRVEPKLFRSIPWDTSEVLNMVLDNLFRFKIKFSLLPFWYDVDDINDLRFLKLHLRYINKELSP